MRAKTGPNTRDKGRLAEQVAADHLEAHGYRIIEKNFLCRLGEIDIIAQHVGELVFVEVRSRGSASSLNPVFSVDRQKQKRIIRAAEVYLGKHYSEVPPARFDVAIVTLGEPAVVEILQNAFSLDFF
ncbi:MAG: YraN family protein [Desulfomonilaceae bacterium]